MTRAPIGQGVGAPADAGRATHEPSPDGLDHTVSVPSAGYCGYWLPGTTWDCRGDGYLWDADCDGWDENDHSDPCPKCNTFEYLQSAAEDATGTRYGEYQGIPYSGADIWRNAVERATAANLSAATIALAEIGPITCDDWENRECPDPDHMVQVIENTQAIEARRAETGTGSVEDESAVPEGNAP